ncbi:ANTAR domain-containing protein [Kribbella sp. NPDC059898]|uniref:ANTAR domain-containing protein n=1 Tax=Kribbella sp. NPDC059898 TaxID=3346995 RepID=UPI003648F6F4
MPDSGGTPASRGFADASSAIDIAEGILMERHDVTSRDALEILRRHATGRQLPVSEIARWLIKTRHLL